MRIASEEHQTLIHIALKGGKARAHWNNGAFNRLSRMGLSEIVNEGKVYRTHKLTPAGIDLILSMSDDLNVNIYPLPEDIAKAKKIVRGLK